MAFRSQFTSFTLKRILLLYVHHKENLPFFYPFDFLKPRYYSAFNVLFFAFDCGYFDDKVPILL